MSDLMAPELGKPDKTDTKTAWIGLVQVLGEAENTTQEYTATVAVWAKKIDDFEQTLLSQLTSQHLRLLHIKQAMPALKWLHEHPEDSKSAELAHSIHTHWPVAFGELLTVNTSNNPPVTADQSYLTITKLGIIEPLDDQRGVLVHKTVPNTLQDVLFGQPEPTTSDIEQHESLNAVPPLKTYAIVDASRIMHWWGTDFVKELSCYCLHQGEAAEYYKRTGPYIVELEEGHLFTKTLFTHIPSWDIRMSSKHLWHLEVGIYIRSRGTIEEVCNHFRKFLRIPNQEKKWFEFNFWKTDGLITFLNMIKDQEEDVNNFIRPNTPYALHSIIAPSVQQTYCIHPSPNNTHQQHRPLVFTPSILNGFDQRIEEQYHQQLATTLYNASPKHCAALGLASAAPVLSMVQALSKELKSHGFKMKTEVTKIAGMGLFYGTHFLSDPRIVNTAITHLVDSTQAPELRVKYFGEAMNALPIAKALLNNSAGGPVLEMLNALMTEQAYPQDTTSHALLSRLCTTFPQLIALNDIEIFVSTCINNQTTHNISSTKATQAHVLCALCYTPYFLDDPLQGALRTIFSPKSAHDLLSQLITELSQRFAS